MSEKVLEKHKATATQEYTDWTAQKILDTLIQHRETLLAMGVRKIGLFGSHRRGTPTADSDMEYVPGL